MPAGRLGFALHMEAFVGIGTLALAIATSWLALGVDTEVRARLAYEDVAGETLSEPGLGTRSLSVASDMDHENEPFRDSSRRRNRVVTRDAGVHTLPCEGENGEHAYA